MLSLGVISRTLISLFTVGSLDESQRAMSVCELDRAVPRPDVPSWGFGCEEHRGVYVVWL